MLKQVQHDDFIDAPSLLALTNAITRMAVCPGSECEGGNLAAGADQKGIGNEFERGKVAIAGQNFIFLKIYYSINPGRN